MVFQLLSCENPFITITPKIPRIQENYIHPIFCSFQNKNSNNTINNPLKSIRKTHILNPKTEASTTADSVQVSLIKQQSNRSRGDDIGQVGVKQMLVLCGLGYWVQGFRCFPWLALNFHMAQNLNLHPSTLQLVQNSANLPMVAKPLYGVLSDALYIAGAHRIPYICIGVLLQILSWGSMAFFPVASQALPTLMAFVLLSNLGASIAEVAKDALVAEYGQKQRVSGLQSYAFMAAAAGGILGNLLGGYFLLKTPSKTMFLIFAILLSLQLVFSLSAKEESLGLAQPSNHNEESLGLAVPSNHNAAGKSILESIKKQLSALMIAISEDSISRPLTWLVASVATVPLLSGSIFCYQTQCLHLDPSIIGMSRVIGQLMLLSLIVAYNRYWKKVPLRKLTGVVQGLYASALLLDFILVRQINLQIGIPNEVFALCFSGLAETLAQFKLLPFLMLFARLCPQGCEGSLTSFSASTLCLSSIVSGFLGIGLASLIGITSGNYSSLPVGILIQFLAALLPLAWIHHVPMSQPVVEKEKKRGMSKRTRKNRKVGRVVLGSVFVYRPKRDSETQR